MKFVAATRTGPPVKRASAEAARARARAMSKDGSCVYLYRHVAEGKPPQPWEAYYLGRQVPFEPGKFPPPP